MKKLNSNELFNIFSQDDHNLLYDHIQEEVVHDDFILFGSIIMGVGNYYLVDQIYSHKYKEQYDSVRESIKLKYFNGLMKYFDRIDVLQPDTVNQLVDEFGRSTIHKDLHQLLHFYENNELYEKCSIIFKYLQFFLVK